jgi:putative spermidine/putrescine transport system permease protein
LSEGQHFFFSGRAKSFPYGKWGFYGACFLIFVFLTLPIFIILPISFSSAKYLQFPPKGFSLQWYQDFFSDRVWISATLLSLRVAAITMVLATVFGTMASLALVRGKFRGKMLVHGFLLSPMIIPVIIIAISVYLFFAKLRLIGTGVGLVLAHTVLALPFVVINVSATLKGFDETLERAAMSLGANRLKTFLKITFPLIRPGVMSGALFAFITSFDEVVIAIFISGAYAVTLPKQMWDGIRISLNPTIAAVSSLLICFSVALMLMIELLRSRMARFKGQDSVESETSS